MPACRAQEIKVIVRPAHDEKKKVQIVYPTIVVENAVSPKGSDLFNQVIAKTKRPFLGDGRATDAHETTHMINSEIRNKNLQFGKPFAFFILPNKAYVGPQPKFSKKLLNSFVPKSVRYSRYDTYFTGNKDWDDYPLYIYDEWSAYIVGASVAIEDHENNISLGDRIALVMPILEFSIYSMAVYDAILKHDPDYITPEFTEFVSDMLKRSETIYKKGRTIWPYPKQDEMYSRFKNSEDCSRLRELSRILLNGRLFAE